MNWRALVYSIATFPLVASAETHYLLVDPGTSPNSNYYRYYNEIRRAFESLRSVGKNPTVIAKNGRWELTQQSDETLSSIALTEEGRKSKSPTNGIPAHPPISGTARNVDDFINAIKAMKIKDGDSLVLYVNAHGRSPRNPSDPSTATIQAWGSEIEFNQLAGALKKLPQGVNLKLVTTTCFGGGVHSISIELPNVCSASMTSYFSKSSSGGFEESLFNKGLWQNFVDTRANTSFAAANLAGFRGDSANLNLGRLSSFDYVDYVMRRGPYEKLWTKTNGSWVQVGSDRVFQRRPDSDYSPVLPADALVLSPYSSFWINLDKVGPPDGACYTNPVQEDINRIAQLSTVLSGITEDTLKESANSQPRELRTAFHDVIDDMKKNGQNYLEAVSK